MRLVRALAAAFLIALHVLGGMPLRAQTVAATPDASQEEALRKVLAAVAGQPLKEAAFQERRSSALFAKPLESRGTLTFKPSGVIEKQTTYPIRETVTVGADTLTIDAGNGTAPQVVRLDAQSGHLASYVTGLRAILGGDDKALRQVFDTRYTGSFDNWKVTLTPKGPTVRRGIRQIVVSGAGAQLRQIETTEINGDVLEMTLTAR